MHKLRPGILSLVGCILVAACSQAAFATTAIVPRDDEMVVESRAIVTGRVIGVSSSVDANTELVYTYIRLAVNGVLKGNIADGEIVLKELGGETRDRGTLIWGMPRFEAGQEVLVYLNTWPDGSLRVHQGFLGKFNINRDATSGRAFVERRLEGENVEIMGGSGNGTNRSELDAYTRMVSGLMETNHKKMRSFEKQYYSDAPLHSEPAEYQSKEFGGQMTPMWAFLNPTTPSRWFEPDSNQPVVFYVNPTGAPSFVQIQEDMQAAMNAWTKTGGSLRVTYGGGTGGCGVQVADGVNTISFNNCDNYFAVSQSCSGLLAVSGIVRYLPGTTKTVGGTRYAKAVESNMSFNPYGLCNFTNRCQIQEVATHEMGHALGLGHSTDSGATMCGYVHFDNRCAALMPDDVQGIKALYPGVSSEGQLNIMTADLPGASFDRDYTANLEATGGTGGYHWQLVVGQMPPGMTLGMSGMLFGKTSAYGNFQFVAQVNDSAGNVSQSSFTIVVKQPGAAPVITDAYFKKKKVFLTGANFELDATAYIDDGEPLWTRIDGPTLITQKRKQKPGIHQIYLVNPDGKRSATFNFFVE
jgi:Matrixin/Putative Ig domain